MCMSSYMGMFLRIVYCYICTLIFSYAGDTASFHDECTYILVGTPTALFTYFAMHN